MYEGKSSIHKLGLSAFEMEGVLHMLRSLYAEELSSVRTVGDETIVLEIKSTSSNGSSTELHIEYFPAMWALCYMIPKKLKLKTIILDVNHKPGLYEYVSQKFREVTEISEKATVKDETFRKYRPSIDPDVEWPSFHDGDI